MKGFVLHDKFYREDDLKTMSVNELNILIVNIQEEIHRTAKQKQKLTTLPNSKKNDKTLGKATHLGTVLMDLQDANNLVSTYRKNARDTMVKDKEYFKQFYKFAKEELRKGQFEKLVELTNQKTGYSIDL